MTHKNFGAILLLIAAALGGPVAVDEYVNLQDTVAQSVAISGPTEAEVGQLVQLKVTGDRPSWLPPVEDAYVDGELCIISFRKPGKYEVIASSVAAMTTRVVKHVITVGTVVPDNNDNSVLVPKPDNPAPKPPAPPEPSVAELTEQVYQWCVEANADKAVCAELGNNFIYAATKADTIDELLSIVAERNRKLDQKSVARPLAQIQQYLYDNLAGEDFTTHQCAFSEIGDGFVKYAGDGGDQGRPDTGAGPRFWQ